MMSNYYEIEERKPLIKLYQGDCLNELPTIIKECKALNKPVVIVTDPPFNIGYHYNNYQDNLSDSEYLTMLENVFSDNSFVVIHYPEMICNIAMKLKKAPLKIVSWTYNSNNPKQHRDIAFFGVKPQFNQVKQPYKNLNDKRIKERIAKGSRGGRLYDWWNINQVKNINKEKTKHPCQMPLEVMKNVVGVLPKGVVVVDPFMGSGTTGVACKELNVDFIGIEIDKEYFDIAKERIEGKDNENRVN